jgi:hypothetical protein
MSKLLSLSQGKFAIVDDDKFDFLNGFKWWVVKSRNGVYYPGRMQKSRVVFLHHVICGFPLYLKQIDHINGDGLDNRKSNLRVVTPRQNNQNLHIHKMSKFPGVSKFKRDDCWKSQIKINGKTHHLGYFEKEADAFAAYQFACNLLGDPVVVND